MDWGRRVVRFVVCFGKLKRKLDVRRDGAYSAAVPVWVELVLGADFFKTTTLVGFLKSLRSRGAEVGVQRPSPVDSIRMNKAERVSQMKQYVRRHPSKDVFRCGPLSSLILHKSKDNHLLVAR